MTLPAVRTRPASRLARRWDLFPDFDNLFDRLDHFMESMADVAPYTTTAADIEETDDAFIVEIDLPGVKREDIDVEVRENQLRVFGETKERERTGQMRRQHRPIGKFDYLIGLPGEVDPQQVEGTLSNGVLMVRLSKAAQARPHRIEIKGA